MSRERGTLLRSEVLHHVIGEANAAIEQLAVAGGAVVRDSRLQQMAHAVQLVGAIHFGEAFGRALFAPVSVQIAARLLCGEDDAGEAVELCTKLDRKSVV